MRTQPKGNEFFSILWWRITLYSNRTLRWLDARSGMTKLMLVWLECMFILGLLGLALYILSLWIKPYA